MHSDRRKARVGRKLDSIVFLALIGENRSGFFEKTIDRRHIEFKPLAGAEGYFSDQSFTEIISYDQAEVPSVAELVAIDFIFSRPYADETLSVRRLLGKFKVAGQQISG